MNHIAILFILAIALMGADCGGSSSKSAAAQPGAAAAQLEFTQPIPEPSGALIFGLALLIVAIVDGKIDTRPWLSGRIGLRR